MIGLLLLLIALTMVFYFVGYQYRDPISWRRRAQAGFLASLGLVALAGYFAWREHQSLGELRQLVDPVPGIKSIVYIPTPGELQTVAQAMAALPGRTWTGQTQQQRRRLAEETGGVKTRYWLLKTTLGPKDVKSFYADPAHRRGWNVAFEDDAWIMMEGTDAKLTIVAVGDWPRPETKVLYIYDGGRP